MITNKISSSQNISPEETKDKIIHILVNFLSDKTENLISNLVIQFF
jgi:hypothetical protein